MKEIERIIAVIVKLEDETQGHFSNYDLAKVFEQDVIKARIEELEEVLSYTVGWDSEKIRALLYENIEELKKGLVEPKT